VAIIVSVAFVVPILEGEVLLSGSISFIDSVRFLSEMIIGGFLLVEEEAAPDPGLFRNRLRATFYDGTRDKEEYEHQMHKDCGTLQRCD
jgi:hypothetical protein